MPGGGRKLTILTRPILLPTGTSYSLGAENTPSASSRRAELLWDAKTKTSKLYYYDGTGDVAHFGPLEAGRYNLAFWYAVSPRGPFKTARDSATWTGEVVSEDITIELQNPQRQE